MSAFRASTIVLTYVVWQIAIISTAPPCQVSLNSSSMVDSTKLLTYTWQMNSGDTITS